MDNIKIEEFTQKIQEAIIKFQKTLPKQLPEEEINLMESLIKKYVAQVLESGSGMHSSLANLVNMAISDSNSKFKCDDENIPYLDMFISDYFLGIANHADQYLYSSDNSYETTKDFFVKSHAQVIREKEAKEREENNTEKEHVE